MRQLMGNNLSKFSFMIPHMGLRYSYQTLTSREENLCFMVDYGHSLSDLVKTHWRPLIVELDVLKVSQEVADVFILSYILYRSQRHVEATSSRSKSLQRRFCFFFLHPLSCKPRLCSTAARLKPRWAATR